MYVFVYNIKRHCLVWFALKERCELEIVCLKIFVRFFFHQTSIVQSKKNMVYLSTILSMLSMFLLQLKCSQLLSVSDWNWVKNFVSLNHQIKMFVVACMSLWVVINFTTVLSLSFQICDWIRTNRQQCGHCIKITAARPTIQIPNQWNKMKESSVSKSTRNVHTDWFTSSKQEVA